MYEPICFVSVAAISGGAGFAHHEQRIANQFAVGVWTAAAGTVHLSVNNDPAADSVCYQHDEAPDKQYEIREHRALL